MRPMIATHTRSAEEILNEAVEREQLLAGYYLGLMNDVGGDIQAVLSTVREQHVRSMDQLRAALDELGEQRALTAPIAD